MFTTGSQCERLTFLEVNALLDNIQSGASMAIHGEMGACAYMINGIGARNCVLEPWLTHNRGFSPCHFKLACARTGVFAIKFDCQMKALIVYERYT